MNQASNVLPLPGLRPAYFNVVKMPESTVQVYRRAFRVSPEKVVRGDFSEVIAELVGMKFIEPGQYIMREMAQWHGIYDVILVGEEAPRYRLFPASSSNDE